MAKKRVRSLRSTKRPRRVTKRPLRARPIRAPRRAAARSRLTAAARSRQAAPALAAETIQVTFDFRDVSDQPVRDPDTRFTFRRLSDNRQIADQITAELVGTPVVFALPVQTGGAVVCDIDLQRYRFARSPVFFRTPGSPITRPIPLLREPLEWTPAFKPWSELSASFAGLKKALEGSADVVLHKTGQSLGKLTGDVYDAMTGADVLVAKTGLLNTYYRLRTIMEPLSDQASWFSFVTRIIAIDRERFLAFVDPNMETIVTQIHEHIDDFRADYERTPAENHRGNVPVAMQSRISRMISIKSSHDKGNFQLTLTHLTGPDEVLLDADIDENGRLLAHFIDLFKHKISGGTHPHDIHEILTAQDRATSGFDLGYQLT